MNLISQLQQSALTKKNLMEEVAPITPEVSPAVEPEAPIAPTTPAVVPATPAPVPATPAPVPAPQVNILQVLFESRDLTHYWHLQATSYATHVTLSGYYDAILLLADSFMEALQGVTGDRVKGPMTIQLVDYTPEVCVAHLNKVKEQIVTIHKTVADYTDLTNILDEMLGEINKTLYLLTLQ